MPQPHERHGSQSSPLSWKPPTHQTRIPCSRRHQHYANQQVHLQVTLAHQINAPSLLLKPLGAALRTHGSQKAPVSTIQQLTHQRLSRSHSDNPIQKAILLSQTAKNTSAHLQQHNSEACEADDRSHLHGASCWLTQLQATSQFFAHMPKRQRSQAHTRMPPRRSPTTLHDLQKRWKC